MNTSNDAKEIFSEAVERRPEEREAFLDHVCEGRSELVWHTSRRASLEAVASGLDSTQSAVAVKAVERTVGLLERNVNPRLAVEDLMLAVPHPQSPEGVGPS